MWRSSTTRGWNSICKSDQKCLFYELSKEEWPDRDFLFVFVHLPEPGVVERLLEFQALLGVGDQQLPDEVLGFVADRLPVQVVQVVDALDGVVADVFTELAVKGQEAPQPRCRPIRT